MSGPAPFVGRMIARHSYQNALHTAPDGAEIGEACFAAAVTFMGAVLAGTAIFWLIDRLNESSEGRGR